MMVRLFCASFLHIVNCSVGTCLLRKSAVLASLREPTVVLFAPIIAINRPTEFVPPGKETGIVHPLGPAANTSIHSLHTYNISLQKHQTITSARTPSCKVLKLGADDKPARKSRTPHAASDALMVAVVKSRGEEGCCHLVLENPYREEFKSTVDKN